MTLFSSLVLIKFSAGNYGDVIENIEIIRRSIAVQGGTSYIE